MKTQKEIQPQISPQKKIHWLLFGVFIMIASLGFMWSIQPSFFFFPWHDEESYKRLKQEDQFIEIILDVGGKDVHGWLKNNNQNEKSPLLIFFGGNANNSSNACATFIDNNSYDYFEGYNFLMVDYPGYGLSEGKPSDKTMFQTALAAYDYAVSLDTIDKNNVIIMGYSIGTGPATYLASQRDVKGLILLAPYDCALSLYNNTLDIFHGPVRLLARYKFDSKTYAQNVLISPLIIASQNDEVIPFALSENLSKHFPESVNFITLEGVFHNDIIKQENTLCEIQKYLQQKLITE